MKNTLIEWTENTWNPWIGCTKVSPGCANCYAEVLMDTRYGRAKWGDGNPRSRTSQSYWKQPLAWNREIAAHNAKHGDKQRIRVFCASLADWLDYGVSTAWRVDLLNLISSTPNLDWLLLTKRPESWSARMHEAAYAAPLAARWINDLPPHNVWFGVSVEDQIRADERLPILAAIPAHLRFLSMEPLLGPVTLDMHLMQPDWIIVGGESGANAREMKPEWARSLRDQAVAAKILFFFKQWGGVNKKAAGNELDGHTWNQFPQSV